MGNTETLVDLVPLLQRDGFRLTKGPAKAFPAKAFEWLNKADFAKNTEDTFRLAQCKRLGLGTDKDAAGSRSERELHYQPVGAEICNYHISEPENLFRSS